MLNELRIRYFLALSETGNYTMTAQKLYISQQALSKQIALLEQDLKCVLIDRTSKKIALTEEGEIYRKAFVQISGVLEQAKYEANVVGYRRNNVINIGCLSGLKLLDVLIPLCRPFMDAHADYKLWGGMPEDFGSLFRMLAEDKFDLIFYTESWAPEEYPEGIETAVFLRSPLYFYASNAYADPNGEKDLQTIAGLKFVTFRKKSMNDLVKAEFERCGLGSPEFWDASNIDCSQMMAEMGQSVALGSSLSALRDSSLVWPLKTVQSDNILVSWNRHSIRKPALALINYLKSNVMPCG